jgi:hypothetical protein
MILTAGAAPIFLTKNYINTDVITAKVPGIFTATTMQAIAPRILDMDPFAYWQGSVEDDTISETVDIELYEGEAQALRTDIGLLALLNTNFKDFTVALSSDGGATFHTTYTVTGNTAANWISDISAAPKSANFIRITATKTIVANAAKKLGTAVAAGLLKQMTAIPVNPISQDDKKNKRVLTMADGSKDISYIKRSAASNSFYSASFKFKQVTYAEILELQAMDRDNPAFLFYPEPGDKAGEIFYSHFTSSFKITPTSDYKGAGYDLGFAVEEIG